VSEGIVQVLRPPIWCQVRWTSSHSAGALCPDTHPRSRTPIKISAHHLWFAEAGLAQSDKCFGTDVLKIRRAMWRISIAVKAFNCS
jgi:hypothetical protein